MHGGLEGGQRLSLGDPSGGVGDRMAKEGISLQQFGLGGQGWLSTAFSWGFLRSV